ncbi:MAG: hypothetical protein ACI38Z_05735, partial [Parafannyhessea sp.]|uniref:hypothetical protein n=1 Tax=Parafannyhessea sp. TaxID=2847324 RepID=UPI003EFC7A1F
DGQRGLSGDVALSLTIRRVKKSRERLHQHLPSASGMKHLMLIRNGYAEWTYGPEPYIGDGLEAEA